MTEDEAADFLTECGYTVFAPGECIVEKRDNDAALAANWQQVLAVLRMSEDLARGSARLTLDTCFGPEVDPRPLYRNGVLRMVDTVLATAIVRRRDPIARETNDA